MTIALLLFFWLEKDSFCAIYFNRLAFLLFYRIRRWQGSPVGDTKEDLRVSSRLFTWTVRHYRLRLHLAILHIIQNLNY